MQDPEQMIKRLRTSPFRHRFRLLEKEKNYLANRGLEEIMEDGREFVEKRIGPAHPKNDGKQTPMRNHPVFIAQHATASCCRKCLEKWHKIPQGNALSEEEKGYVLKLIRAWIEDQQEPHYY